MDSGRLADRLASCYTGAVYDVLNQLGRHEQVLPSSIASVDRGVVVAGPAFPVCGHRGDIDDHESVLRWTRLLGDAPAGCVVVCQPNDDRIAHMGELSAETLHSRGVRGYIVDGGCRDVAFVRRLGFPVFCRYSTPKDLVGRWILDVDRLGAPVEIGGVTVAKGDFVLGDDDGVVVVPGEIVSDVVSAAETVMQTENLVRKAILSGAHPTAAFLEHGKF